MRFLLIPALMLGLVGSADAQTFGGPNAGLPIPQGSSPITVSATGTTAAVSATLAADTLGKRNTYLCGFSIRANATAAANGQATVTGINTGTMTFQQFTAPVASGIGVVEETFNPCQPAASVNTAIVILSAAAGTGGTATVNAWGYQY